MPDPVTISIPETHDRAELPGLLRVIASQIEDDYREGYHPRWMVTPEAANTTTNATGQVATQLARDFQNDHLDTALHAAVRLLTACIDLAPESLVRLSLGGDPGAQLVLRRVRELGTNPTT